MESDLEDDEAFQRYLDKCRSRTLANLPRFSQHTRGVYVENIPDDQIARLLYREWCKPRMRKYNTALAKLSKMCKYKLFTRVSGENKVYPDVPMECKACGHCGDYTVHVITGPSYYVKLWYNNEMSALYKED